jgi:hypothetical protein
MRLLRPFSAAVVTLVAAAAFTGPAGAVSNGAGTALSSTKLVSAKIGDNGSILDLSVLGDEAQASIDSSAGTPGAFARLRLAKVASSIVPNNPVTNGNFGEFEAKSTGPTNVPIAAAAFPTASPVLSGNLTPGVLSATLNSNVADSGLNIELSNVNAVGGLISVGSIKSNLSSTTSGDSSTASRALQVKDVNVLDLQAFLQGLGISLPNLTVAQVAALVDGLAATMGVPLPSGQTTYAGAVGAINTAIDDLNGAVAGAPANAAVVTSAIDTTTKSLLGTLGVPVSAVPTAANTLTEATTLVTGLVNDLQAQLNLIATDGIKGLTNVALLRLEGVEVGVTAKAVSSVNDSVAAVTGKVGKVMVGNVSLPGLDLTSALDAINASVAAVNTKLASVLGLINSDLANMVKVSVLDKATQITSANGYTKATAGITGLTATITPPAALKAIVDTINATTAGTVATVMAGSGQQLSTLGLSGAMNQLASTLSLGASALTSPTVVKVAEVLAASNYRSSASGTTTPGSSGELPRTGGTSLLLFGALAAILAFGARRFFLHPAVVPVRNEK